MAFSSGWVYSDAVGLPGRSGAGYHSRQKGGLYVAGNTSNAVFLTTPGVYEQFYPGGAITGYAAKFDLTTASPSELWSVVNAASLREWPKGDVAPGEIVTLYGRGFPANPKVMFDSYSAPVLYASANQINAVVPFEVTAPNTTVSVQGVDRRHTVTVWPVVPAIFTTNGGLSGPAAALNEDGSVNSSSNPAKVGSIIAVYMTGAGAMTPPIADGQPGPLQPPFPKPVIGVGASVGGLGADVVFVGQAPGLVAGAVQVNVRIPPGTTKGNVQLIVYVGDYRTQIGPTTVAIQ